MLKAVIDTNVILTHLIASRADSPPVQIVEAFGDQILPVFSAETFYELERKIANPKFERYFDLEMATLFLHDLRKLSTWVTIPGELQICRDIDDNKILETALVAGAQVITTGDKDILTLADNFPISILTPADFVSAYLLNGS